MIHIASVPYKKTYKFSYFSDAFIIKYVLYALALIIPFFMVFSVNNFYLSFADNITKNPQFTFNYNYHLTIVTDASVYTYSTFYGQINQPRSISFSHEENHNELTHTWVINWIKPMDEKVKKVSLLTVMGYKTSSIIGQGAIYGQGTGYDLSDLNIVGKIQVRTGIKDLSPAPTSFAAILAQYNYNIGMTQLALQQNYKTYLQSSTQYLSTNMPNNLFKCSFKIKTPSIVVLEESASILGQLVWSFKQYFPIACVFFIGVKLLFGFFMREGVVKRAVIHDKF